MHDGFAAFERVVGVLADLVVAVGKVSVADVPWRYGVAACFQKMHDGTTD